MPYQHGSPSTTSRHRSSPRRACRPEARTGDPDWTFADVGLDSLAFLQLQAELDDRYRRRAADEAGHRATPSAEIVATSTSRIARTEVRLTPPVGHADNTVLIDADSSWSGT